MLATTSRIALFLIFASVTNAQQDNRDQGWPPESPANPFASSNSQNPVPGPQNQFAPSSSGFQQQPQSSNQFNNQLAPVNSGFGNSQPQQRQIPSSASDWNGQNQNQNQNNPIGGASAGSDPFRSYNQEGTGQTGFQQQSQLFNSMQQQQYPTGGSSDQQRQWYQVDQPPRYDPGRIQDAGNRPNSDGQQQYYNSGAGQQWNQSNRSGQWQGSSSAQGSQANQIRQKLQDWRGSNNEDGMSSGGGATGGCWIPGCHAQEKHINATHKTCASNFLYIAVIMLLWLFMKHMP